MAYFNLRHSIENRNDVPRRSNPIVLTLTRDITVEEANLGGDEFRL